MKLSARAALERYRKIDYMRFFYEDSLANWLCKSNIVIVIGYRKLCEFMILKNAECNEVE